MPMIRLLKFIGRMLWLPASAVTTLAAVSPEVAESNLKAWLDWIRLGHLGEDFTETTDHWVFWTGVAVLAGWIAVMVARRMAKGSSKGAQEHEERIYTTKTAGELFASVVDLTELEMQRFVQPHIGKWIRVQSVIQDMRREGEHVVVRIGHWFEPTPVLRFSKDPWFNRLETMSRGHTLAACGKIQFIGLMAMVLVDCEIVDTEAENDAFRSVSGRGLD